MAKAASDIDSVPAIASLPVLLPKQLCNRIFCYFRVTVIGLALGLLVAPFLARKFKGMSVSEVVAYVFDLLRAFIDLVVNLSARLIKLIATNKNKILPGK